MRFALVFFAFIASLMALTAPPDVVSTAIEEESDPPESGPG